MRRFRIWMVAVSILGGIAAMATWQVGSTTGDSRPPEWLSVWTYGSGVGCGPHGCTSFEVRTNRITGTRQYRTDEGSWAADY